MSILWLLQKLWLAFLEVSIWNSASKWPSGDLLSQWQLWPWPFPDHVLSQRSTTHYLACLISHQWLSHSYSFTTKRCFKRPRLALCVPLLCRYNQNRVLSSAMAHIWGENILHCPVRPRALWDISSVLIFCGLAARSSSSHLSVRTTKTDTNCSQMFPKRTHCQAKSHSQAPWALNKYLLNKWVCG